MNSFAFLLIVLCACKTSYAFVCPVPDGQFPHQFKLDSFYQCTGGNGFLMTCPTGLVYNAFRRYCDWPDDTASSISSIGKNDGKSNLEQPNSNSNPQKSSQVDPISGVISKFTCPVYNGMFQVENDCKHFVHCEQGIPYWKICGKGTRFNARLQICDWPQNSGCNAVGTSGSTIKIIKPHFLINPTSPRPDWNSIPNENLNPIAKPIPTRPNPNSVFPDKPNKDESIGVEEPEVPKLNVGSNQNNDDTKPVISANDGGSNYVCDWCFKCPRLQGLFENEYDRQTYYECVNGNSFLMYCSKGLTFKASLGRCEKDDSNEPTVDPTTLIQARTSRNKPKRV